MMSDKRPDPDLLLARVKQAEARSARGKLKIFFGAYPGVGKTFSMLEAAHAKRREGVDVVVGLVESHGRTEIEPMLAGLEVIPRRDVTYRSVALKEFDLDAGLARRPGLILVDELAHTNAPGSRHVKRWQDAMELLEEGIDVYTTLNVQHIESLNDIVAQITGVTVRETLPDSVLEEASEVELVDLPPEDLLKRLAEGKVYLPQQADRAREHFFREANLIALRELALRVMADRVNTQVQTARLEEAVRTTWPTAERLLVCVGPSPSSARLIRAARRLAAGLRAEWIAVNVETPGQLRLPQKTRDRIVQNLRLAAQLGGETITLSGTNLAEEIISYARARNVTKIVIGKPVRPRWKDLLLGSPVDDLVRISGEIDIYVMRGDSQRPAPAPTQPAVRAPIQWHEYGLALAAVATATAIAYAIHPHLSLTNLVMVYLLGVVVVAARTSRWPAILASVLSVLAFDVCFVPPRYSLTVTDSEYLVTFAVMLLVALVISDLTIRTREHAQAARLRERRTSALHALSQHLARTRGTGKLLEVAVGHIAEIFESDVVALMPDADGTLQVQAASSTGWTLTAKERSVAHWVYDLGQMAGRGTQTLSLAEALYVPLRAAGVPLGVLGIRPADPNRLFLPEQLHLLEAFANTAALSLERARLEADARQAQVQAEAERMRVSLLSAVSHDLRTPLAAITGSASTLLESGQSIPSGTQRQLLQDIRDEADRLSRLIQNLLDMTRLQAGALKVHKELQPIEEVVGAAMGRLQQKLHGRTVTTHLPDDLPLVPLDAVLIEQVLVNLLENAIKYTPSASPIQVAAWAENGAMVVEVADRGPGLAAADLEHVFDMFYRGQGNVRSGGAGLGLAICRGIVQAHGGRIWVENCPGGGACFRFSLPLDAQPTTHTHATPATGGQQAG